MAAKGIFKMVFSILAIPIRVLAKAFKAAMTLLMPGMMRSLGTMADAFGTKLEDVQAYTKSVFRGSATKADPTDTDAVFEKTTAALADSKESSDLIPRSEALKVAWKKCQTCLIRIQFGFKLMAADCFLGFTPTKYKLKLGSMPSNGPIRMKCNKECFGLLWKTMSPFKTKPALKEKVYWKDTCQPHSVGMCMMLARVQQCRPEWAKLPKIKGKIHPLAALTGAKAEEKGTIKSGLKSFSNLFKNDKDKAAEELAEHTSDDAGLALCNALRDKSSPSTGFQVNRDSVYNVLMCPKDADRTRVTCRSASKSCLVMGISEGCEYVHEKMKEVEAAGSKKSADAASKGTTTGGDSKAAKSCKWGDMQGAGAILDRCLTVFGCFKAGNDGATPPPFTNRLSPETMAQLVAKHVASSDPLQTEQGKLVSPATASENLFAELSTLTQQSKQLEAWEKSEATNCVHSWKTSPDDLWSHPLWTGKCATWEDSTLTNEVLPFATGAKWEAATGKAQANVSSWLDGVANFAYPKKSANSSPGMILNHGVLLAKILGILSDDEKACECSCCTRLSGEEKTKSCTPINVGSIKKISKDDCNSELCSASYPALCPDVVSQGSSNVATYVEHIGGGTQTCADSAALAGEMVKDADSMLKLVDEFTDRSRAKQDGIRNCHEEILRRSVDVSSRSLPGWRSAISGFFVVRLERGSTRTSWWCSRWWCLWTVSCV